MQVLEKPSYEFILSFWPLFRPCRSCRGRRSCSRSCGNHEPGKTWKAFMNIYFSHSDTVADWQRSFVVLHISHSIFLMIGSYLYHAFTHKYNTTLYILQTDVEIIVFLAIMLHKAPASFGLVTFLLHEGLERSRIRSVSVLLSFCVFEISPDYFVRLAVRPQRPSDTHYRFLGHLSLILIHT